MMRKRKGMKLDQALKLYIALYFVCFLLTWLISVPMLIHVTPQSECLLFVTPYVKYGNSATCNIVGIVPLFVAGASLVLIALHMVQLRTLKAFLRQPGPHSSSDHSRPPHIFWRLVVFHLIVTIVVLIITAIVTSGYAQTCQNLYLEVKNTVRSRVETEKWGTGKNLRNNEIIDIYANDRSINRYTNPSTDSWGNSAFEYGITCRNILTDPEIHSQLKMNHAANPYYKQYYGFWYRHDVADVGDIRYYTYRNNMILEMSMAGSWISLVLWTVILVLMVKERHHIKAHLTDESMFGSEFGSRRSASRMSNQSFDKMSRISQSTNQRSRGGRGQQFDQMSYQGSVQGSTRSGGRRQMNGHNQQHLDVQPIQQPIAAQSGLLNYFSSNPNDGEVDIDAALNEPDQINFTENLDEGPLDTSFGSGGLPDNLGNAIEDFNGPIALGDEVSQAYSSDNNLSTYEQQFGTNLYPGGDVANRQFTNPNRQQGRRGGGRPQSGARPASNASFNAPHRPTHQRPSQVVDFRQPQRAHSQQADFRVPSQQQHISKSPQSSQRKTSAPRSPNVREQYLPPSSSNQHYPSPSGQQKGYRTALGNQSMI